MNDEQILEAMGKKVELTSQRVSKNEIHIFNLIEQLMTSRGVITYLLDKLEYYAWKIAELEEARTRKFKVPESWFMLCPECGDDLSDNDLMRNCPHCREVIHEWCMTDHLKTCKCYKGDENC